MALIEKWCRGEILSGRRVMRVDVLFVCPFSPSCRLMWRWSGLFRWSYFDVDNARLIRVVTRVCVGHTAEDWTYFLDCSVYVKQTKTLSSECAFPKKCKGFGPTGLWCWNQIHAKRKTNAKFSSALCEENELIPCGGCWKKWLLTMEAERGHEVRWTYVCYAHSWLH